MGALGTIFSKFQSICINPINIVGFAIDRKQDRLSHRDLRVNRIMRPNARNLIKSLLNFTFKELQEAEIHASKFNKII